MKSLPKLDLKRLKDHAERLVRLADGEIVVVRPIFPTDIFGCFVVYQPMFPETKMYLVQRLISWAMLAVSATLFSIRVFRRLFVNLLPRAATLAFVATNAIGKIIALSFLYRLRNLASEGYVAHSGTFIAEDYQSRGLDTYLLMMKTEKASLFDIRELLATGHLQNRKVIGLWKKIGFKPLERIPSNRLLMRPVLNNKNSVYSDFCGEV